eukprot:326360_1
MAKRQKKGDGALKNKKVGRKPAHQNKFKFRHNKNSSQTAVIAAITLTGLCRKCQNVIEWRKQYRKYKVLKAPKKVHALPREEDPSRLPYFMPRLRHFAGRLLEMQT